jgi:hypothetical protein
LINNRKYTKLNQDVNNRRQWIRVWEWDVFGNYTLLNFSISLICLKIKVDEVLKLFSIAIVWNTAYIKKKNNKENPNLGFTHPLTPQFPNL